MVPRETFDAILADVIGGVAVRKAIANHHIGSPTFYAALNSDPELQQRYARAKEAQLDAIADETIEIADAEPPVIMETTEGGQAISAKLDGAFISWQRNKIDTRKWLLSKLAPKKYGDAQRLEHTGAEGGPIESRVTVEFVGQAAGGVSLPVAADR